MILDVTEPTSLHSVLPSGSRPRQTAPLVAAVLLHGLILGFALWHGPALWQARPFSGDPLSRLAARGGGGGGGGANEIVFILPPASAAAPASVPTEAPVAPVPIETPVSTPVTTPPQAVVATVDTATPSAATDSSQAGPGDGPGAAGGTGGGTGGGNGPGTGPGSGPGTGSGEGGDITPPVWISGPMHWGSPPKELRGRSLNATFWIGPDGKVERVAFDPAIEDRKYREYLEDLVLKSYRFKPARDRNGAAVPSVYPMTLSLRTK